MRVLSVAVAAFILAAGLSACAVGTDADDAARETTASEPPPTEATTRKPDAYRVTDVVDGDTVKLTRLAGGGQVTVRVLGIDTPETKDPRKGIGCHGPEASAWASRLLQDKRVTIRTDATQDTRDKYGRLLAYITLPNGKDYSTLAARSGHAKYYLYRTPVAQAAKIQAAERAARSAGKGLWGAPCHGNTDAPKAQVQPKPKPAPQPAQPDSGNTYFKNCDAARAAGAAPVRAGDPGYGRHLDRDGDGVGCE